MSLSDLLHNGTPSAHKVDKVLAVLDVLNDAERDAFQTLINDELWSAPQIALTLREMGFNITGDQIRNFRTKIKTGRVKL